MAQTFSGNERRKKRSTDPLVAMHYQLAQSKDDAGLEAIVVADPSGMVVAGAGGWALCEELAAYAPLLVNDHPMSMPVSSRVEDLRRDVKVLPMMIDGHEVLLCARGSSVNESWVARAAEGVSRILQRAA